jgi:phosphate starvation-inducible membrane PsiE
VISLVLALASSISSAVGKQLEIMSLIQVRQSFKELTYFDEPVVWDTVTGEVGTRVLYILSDAVGALVIFGLLAVYTRCQRHPEFTRDDAERASFVATKKLVSLLLLTGLALIAVDVGAHSGLTWEATEHYFEVVYTLLIFADVLVVLISLRYSTAYPVVLRYFGFAAATVLIRLALTAPRFVDAGLGIVAALFALALTWVCNRSTGRPPVSATDPSTA